MVSCWEITAVRDQLNLVMRVTIPFTIAVSEEAMRRKVENVLLIESSGLVDTGEIWRRGREKRKGEEGGRRGREKREGEEEGRRGREKREGEEEGRRGREKREGEEGGRRGREKREGGSKRRRRKEY